MIEIINNHPDAATQKKIVPLISSYYDEVRLILPALPERLEVYFDNSHLIPETGDGGFAYAPGVMTLSFDTDFFDKGLQLKSLRETIFHEAFHLVQGHTFEGSRAIYRTALDSAIYEGCATVFEREIADSSPLWGDYSRYSGAQLTTWRDALAAIPIEEFINPEKPLWDNWAFWDSETKERWRLYKTGTWLVDEALQRSGLKVIDFQHMSAEEILLLVG